jgi:hypothetical protein
MINMDRGLTDIISAVAVAIVAGASWALKAMNMTPLLTIQEGLNAFK